MMETDGTSNLDMWRISLFLLKCMATVLVALYWTPYGLLYCSQMYTFLVH